MEHSFWPRCCRRSARAGAQRSSRRNSARGKPKRGAGGSPESFRPTKPGTVDEHLVGAAKNVALNRERSDHPTTRVMVKSVRRRAMLRVQRRTPGQRVAKNRHVRRQLRRPRSFPLSQDLVRCRTKHCNRASKLHLFRAPFPKSTHARPPSILYPPLLPASRRIRARLCENRGRVRAGTRRFFGSWSCGLHEGRSSRCRMTPSIDHLIGAGEQRWRRIADARGHAWLEPSCCAVRRSSRSTPRGWTCLAWA